MTYLTVSFALFAALACGGPSTPAPGTPAVPLAAAPEPVADATSEVLAAGVIEAPEDLPEAAAVFVSLRAGDRPGPPLAAKRLPAGPFPLRFEITEADRPMVQGPVPGNVMLKVTLDVDGNPMKRSAEDLEVVVPVEKGATDVKALLAPRAAED